MSKLKMTAIEFQKASAEKHAIMRELFFKTRGTTRKFSERKLPVGWEKAKIKTAYTLYCPKEYTWVWEACDIRDVGSRDFNERCIYINPK